LKDHRDPMRMPVITKGQPYRRRRCPPAPEKPSTGLRATRSLSRRHARSFCCCPHVATAARKYITQPRPLRAMSSVDLRWCAEFRPECIPLEICSSSRLPRRHARHRCHGEHRYHAAGSGPQGNHEQRGDHQSRKVSRRWGCSKSPITPTRYPDTVGKKKADDQHDQCGGDGAADDPLYIVEHAHYEKGHAIRPKNVSSSLRSVRPTVSGSTKSPRTSS